MARKNSNIPERDYVKKIKPPDAIADDNIQTSPDEITKAIKPADAYVSGDIPVSQDEPSKTLKTTKHAVSSDILASEDTIKKSILKKSASVSGEISSAPDENIKQVKRADAFVSSESPPAEDTAKKYILNKPTIVSSDIPTSPDENKKHTKPIDALVNTENPTSPDEIKKHTKPIDALVNTENPTSPDEIKKAYKSSEPIVSSDIPVSENIINKSVLGKPINVNTEISTAPDEIKKNIKQPDTFVSGDIPVSEDIQKKNIHNKPILASTEIATAPDEIKKNIKQPDTFVNTEISTAPDEIKKHIASPPAFVKSEVPVAEDDIGKMPRFETPFVGRYVPSDDPINIGLENYSLLQNLRYKNDGLEGVNGNSRINTTSVVSAIKEGIHFKTNYTEDSYVIVQRDDGTNAPDLIINKTDIPEAGDFYNDETVTITLGLNNTIVFRSTYDSGTHDSGWCYLTLEAGHYSAFAFETHLTTKMNASTGLTYGGGGGTITITFTVTYSATTKKFTITTDDAAYQLKYSFDNSNCDSEIGLTENVVDTWTRPITSDTAIASKDSLKLENIDASLARMSLLPHGHVGVCDQKNNYIWAGDEMPCASFLVFDEVSYTEGTGEPAYIKYIKDRYIENYSKQVNNNIVTDVATIKGMKRQYGSGTDEYSVTHNEAEQKVRYSRTTGSVNFVDAGMHVGDVVLIGSGGTMASGNTGEWKVITVGTTYFEVYRSDPDITGNEAGKTCNGIFTYGKVFAVGSTRPLQQVNITISTANTITSTIHVLGWNGSRFIEYDNSSDGTASGGITLAVSGSITFSNDTYSDEPVFIGSNYLYYYLFRIPQDTGTESSNGIDATISNITVKSNIVDLANIWDGIYINCIQCLVRRGEESAKKPIDYTLEVLKKSYVSQSLENYSAVLGNGNDLMTSKGYIEVMFSSKICGLKIDMLIGNFIDPDEIILKVLYNYNNSWNEATVLRDGTAYRTHTDDWQEYALEGTLYGNGVVLWQLPTDESKITINGVEGYAYRLTLNDISNAKIDDGTAIDTIYGIPAFYNITNLYKFPFMFANRALWCNSQSDKEYNRVDYSKTNAPDVYNGMDASGQENERSLRFGSFEPLTCAVRLFNLYGDSLDEIALFFKYCETYLLTGNTPENFRIKQISDNIGCPAHRTLKTAEISFKPEGGGPEQNIAMWLSEQGPVMFRNNVLTPVIQDIEHYFDPSSSDYINKDKIGIAAGEFDTKHREYNLLIPTGASTTNNVWIVFDLVRQKWYEKTGETDMPQGFIGVEDVYGNKYLYGYTEDGYLLRIEDPDTLYWSDGTTGITNIVQTGDLLLTKSLWDNVLLYAHKIIFLDNPADEGTITIDLYVDGNAAPERHTATDISFTATDTISGTGFDTTVFKAGMPLFISGSGESDNNETFIIASASATTITVESDNEIADETAGNAITIKTLNLPYKKTMNEIDGFRYRNLISHLNRVGYSFKIKYTIESCTSTKPKLLGHGLLWSPAREDLLDKDDWAW